MDYAFSEGIWSALGIFNSVIAAILYDRLRSIKGGVQIAKIFE